MDIAALWRGLRTEPGETPRPGVSRQTAPPGISISFTQSCVTPIPLRHGYVADQVNVVVMSDRPGQPGQVIIAANLNSQDLSYQGPTWTVGEGEFTATTAQLQASFVLLPTGGLPVLGVGAQATWQDGTPDSAALTYAEIGCRPPAWWQWLIRIVAITSRSFESKASGNST
jgi:hypothetical protein